MSFFPNPTVEDGVRVKSDTTNDTVEGLLNDILRQMRITNMHLVIISDNHITQQEIDSA
jgi:hypothetical protein